MSFKQYNSTALGIPPLKGPSIIPVMIKSKSAKLGIELGELDVDGAAEGAEVGAFVGGWVGAAVGGEEGAAEGSPKHTSPSAPRVGSVNHAERRQRWLPGPHPRSWANGSSLVLRQAH